VERSIAMLSPKPAKCKFCKVRLERIGPKIHDACIGPWWEANKDKVQKKTLKASKAHDRERRRALETIPELIKAAQKEFNAYIRLRDVGQACICCGHPLGAGEVGGAYDCGHYRSTGSAPHLRFDERNAHAQRKHCNRYGAGRAVDYRIGLIKRIGPEAVEMLEADNALRKWRADELRAIRTTYSAKRRELERAMENTA
jgi:hypothetical protein